MFNQHLPTYIHNFQSYQDWHTVESDHYVFNFTEGSEAEKDIVHITHTQEEAFKKVIDSLHVEQPTKKISYYFYPNEQLKTELMGDDWYAQSIYNEFCVHVLYTEEHKPIGPHEDTHLLSLPWGLSWCFLQEGLAEYMTGHSWDGGSHIEKVREGIAKGIALRPSSQLSDTDWLETPDEDAIYYYALAGSWVNHIILKYGLNTLKNLYVHTSTIMSREEIISAYELYIGVPIDSLESDYFHMVNNV